MNQRGRRILTLTMSLVVLFGTATMYAQKSKLAQDKAAIRAMEGCYEVSFQYTETFSPEVDYEKAYDYTSAALEWAEVIEDEDGMISLQHLLIVYDTMIIKHWRQDWCYECDREFTYDKDFTWKFTDLSKKATKGKWTQSVYQVDDSPRYAGTATWTHVDGESSWYNKADSPLPRREYTKRDDYNVMKRGNRVHITDNGWIHEQDNDKVIRSADKEDQLLVQEKGYNVYTKRPDADCKLAVEWWQANQDMWASVRSEWDRVYSEVDELHLQDKVDGKKMYEHLFYTKQPWENEDIARLIETYMESEDPRS